MSDQEHNAIPIGGYVFDEDDVFRMQLDMVKCEACGCVIPKDDSERDEDDTVYLCAECGESIRKMNSGRVA